MESELGFEFAFEFAYRPASPSKTLLGDSLKDPSRPPQNQVSQDLVKLPPVSPHTVRDSVRDHRNPELLPLTLPFSPFGRLTHQLQLAVAGSQCELP